MEPSTPFTLEILDLTSLGQDRAVEFFRRLLWAESSRTGIGRGLIDVPGCINAPDGGIDARIDDAKPSTDEVIPLGTSGFQIKSSDLGPVDCRRELHEANDLTADIKPEVRRLLGEGGTYVLVLFADLTAAKRLDREQALEQELMAAGFAGPKVRVYSANQVQGFSERFISVVTWLKRDSSQCLPYDSWAGMEDVRSPRLFVPDGEREKLIQEIQDKLRTPGEDCPVVRVVGLPGIGKTRLAFESLAPDDLRSRVVYVQADAFRASSLFHTLQNDQEMSAILVVDECTLHQHDLLVRALSGRGSRLALITLSHDATSAPPPTSLLTVRALGSDEIGRIILAEAPSLPASVVRRLSEFADGYPRIAVLLTQSYLTTGGSADEFITISDDALMARLVYGGEAGSPRANTTRRVLTGISLFGKVGFEEHLEKEARWVAAFMEVGWTEFREVVWEQRRRGVIRGQFYLYVTPFMLRVYLLTSWWEGFGFTPQAFIEFAHSIPDDLQAEFVERFFEHVPLVSTTDRGKRFVEGVLGDEGLFADGTLLRSKLGSSFFLRLAEADPRSALGCLIRTVGKWTPDELLLFVEGRRQVVWALEKIVIWRDLFPGGARLLLALAEAENETVSNNSTGVFVELFSPAYGLVAPTEASPEERFPILAETLRSESRARRLIGLRAGERALEAQFFSRIAGSESQGLRKEPRLWAPKTYGELFDAYRRVWQLLSGRIDSLPVEEQLETGRILLERARGIARITNLSPMVIDGLEALAGNPFVDRSDVLSHVLQILHYEGQSMTDETRGAWEALRDRLQGTGFPSLLRRYVGLDLIIDRIDLERNVSDQAQPQIERLAEQAMEDKQSIRSELSWLVTTAAKRSHPFGFALGSLDSECSLLPEIVRAQRDAHDDSSLQFLGGYLRSVFERDPERWEAELDALREDDETAVWIPELTWRTGFSEQAAVRVIQLAEAGKVAARQLAFFQFGGMTRAVPEPVFRRWLRFLLSDPNRQSVFIALALVHQYYLGKERTAVLPGDLAFQVLTHTLLLESDDPAHIGTMEEFHWEEIAKDFIQTNEGEALRLAETLVPHFGEDGTILDGFHSRTHLVIGMIAQRFPVEMWRMFAPLLGPPIDSRAFHLREWLRGSDFFGQETAGLLEIFPLDEIWRWVDENVDERAWYLAKLRSKEPLS